MAAKIDKGSKVIIVDCRCNEYHVSDIHNNCIGEVISFEIYNSRKENFKVKILSNKKKFRDYPTCMAQKVKLLRNL